MYWKDQSWTTPWPLIFACLLVIETPLMAKMFSLMKKLIIVQESILLTKQIETQI